MKKIMFLFVFLVAGGSLSAMVRAGVNVGPGPESAYYGGGYYSDTWYGPGYYYGVYYSDHPTYYAWRRRNYYGGPYYWRHRHHHHHHHHKK